MPCQVIHVKNTHNEKFSTARRPEFLPPRCHIFRSANHGMGFCVSAKIALPKRPVTKDRARRHKNLPATEPKREEPCPISNVAAWRQNRQFSEGCEKEIKISSYPYDCLFYILYSKFLTQRYAEH